MLKRIHVNPAIAAAIEKRKAEYIKTLPDDQLLFLISKTCLTGNLPEYAQKLAYERLDAILLREIQNFDAIPTAEALSRLPDFPSSNAIKRRMAANPSIAAAMEKRGTEYIKALPEKQLLALIGRKGYIASMPEYVLITAHERLDAILLREIQNFDGVPSLNALSGLSNFPNKKTIKNRIDANPGLWMAYHQKRGHTPDQAVELALERNEETKAVRKALNIRLRNLHAYREMIGIIRCFGDLLVDRIAEVSLYPEPLSKAAKETGVALDVVHTPLQPFKQGKGTDIEKANVVVVQGLHRVAAESVTTLFRKVRESLGMGRTVIITHSPSYDKVEGFLEAVHKSGFEPQESGTIFIETPPDKLLLSYGVEQDDLGKVRRKLSGESKVLVFRTIAATEAVPIPSLVKMEVPEGTRLIEPDAEPINIPEGIGKSLSAKFFEDSVVLPSAPFIVDVMHGREAVAVIGYDAHPHRRNALETEVKPGAPAEDYRRIARDLARNMKERQKAGVTPGQINKVPLKRFRNQ